MNTYLKNLIQIIKTASPAEVKVAQKQVEKFWFNYYIPNREEGRKAFGVFFEEIKTFEQIKDIDHQAYFINTLKWALWSGLGEEHFEDWADFMLTYIKNPSGKIRQAVIKVTEYLISDLRLNIKHDYEIVRSEGLIWEEFEKIVANNIMRFGNFVMEVEDLIERNQEPKFRRYKYLSSLPVGVYKSLNLLLAEVLLPGDYQESLYQDFLNDLRAKRKKLEPPELTNMEIWEGRKEMESNLEELIEETGSVLKIEDIKSMIYNEDGQECLRKIVVNFDRGQDIKELNKILQIVTTAWNYWPHKKLNGLSPAKKSLEY